MKTIRVMIFIITAVLIASCSGKTWNEIDRQKEQINWHIDRINEVLGSIKSGDIKDVKSDLVFRTEGLEQFNDRLADELGDIKSSETDAGSYSDKEIRDGIDICDEMLSDAKTLSEYTAKALEAAQYNNTKMFLAELGSIKNEAEKLSSELLRLKESLEIMSGSDEAETEDPQNHEN